jgi:chromosome segregation ATPase
MSFEEPKRKIPDSEYERHTHVIDRLLEANGELSKEREELIKIAVGLKEKFGAKDERVQTAFSEIDEIERKIQGIAAAISQQVDLYPLKKETENTKISDLLKELQVFKKELTEINLKIGEIANRLNDFIHDENLPKNEVYREEVRKLKDTLKEWEERRIQQKELIQQIEFDIRDLKNEGEE